jgi:hypothetical protein
MSKRKGKVRPFVEAVHSGFAYGLKDGRGVDLLWYLVKDDGTPGGMDKAYAEASRGAASLQETYKRKPRLIHRRIEEQSLRRKAHSGRVASRYLAASDSDLIESADLIEDALGLLEDAHLLLSYRDRGPSLADDYNEAAKAVLALEKISGELDKHAKALRRHRRMASEGLGDRALWSGRRNPTPEEIDAALHARWQDWVPHPLPDDLDRFFKREPGAIVVSLSSLTPIRAREKGIANANRFMWLAYWGVKDRRKPVSLQNNGDGTYTVLDGNSTFANAQMSGWKGILGKVER